MSQALPTRAFEVRHLQMMRALFAAVAAVMITFSSDHSAAVGMAVFSGFAVATALVLLIAVWLVYPAGRRGVPLALGLIALVAGMAGGMPALRETTVFFVVVIAWALLSGLVEGIAGWRALRRAPAGGPERSEARDGLTVGAITLVFGLAMLFVPTQYALEYRIEEAHQSFTLTGITIGVGVFGAYTAIVAVYLAIAAFSPRREPTPVAGGGAA